MNELMPIERIENKIYLIRGQKVMLDRDLAEFYGVETSVLNQAVKRNKERFPEDFMFSLTRQEIANISQIVICSPGVIDRIKHAKNVNAFTEQGLAMLSGLLHSRRAIKVNIAIMRAFTRLRQILSSHKELARKVEWLEKRYSKHEIEITVVFKLLKKLMGPSDDEKPKRKIGFIQ
ncbi:MAG: ORF6N domain-containing protein [Candidatus Margulisbacteria bacterium]|nr:ORF6N domain-containing protein [Candidatus Margulisiibacteriota bacterium]